jgi:hypothetical protein
VRTSRNIGLGDPYSKVILAYGHHDEFARSGDLYVIRYNKMGVAFQFDAKTNRVTGIFVAAGVPTLGAGFTQLGGGDSQAGGGPVGGPQAPGGPGFGGSPGRGGSGGSPGAAGPAI